MEISVPDLFGSKCVQVLEFFLVFDWADHGHAVAVSEKNFQEPPDFIFRFDRITGTFEGIQCLFLVLFCSDWIIAWVDKFQGKVSDNPQERREVLGNRFFVHIWITVFDFDLLSKVYYLRLRLQGALVYGPHWVVDKITWEKNRKEKDPRIVVYTLVDATEALCVNY